MIFTEEMKEQLADALSPKRFVHSQGVAGAARELARRYGADETAAETAGWLHDCAKQLPLAEMQAHVQAAGYSVDREMWNSPALLHGPAGAAVARACYGVTEVDILRAIFYHTVGRKMMTPLEKIVFLADYIEPSRNFPGVNTVRTAAKKSLDEGVMAGIDTTLHHLLETGSTIYSGTVETRNWILKREDSID